MNKYEIAKKVEQEDTLNATECLGYDTSRLSNDECLQRNLQRRIGRCPCGA